VGTTVTGPGASPFPLARRLVIDRLSECVHVFVTVHAGAQSTLCFSVRDSLIFVNVLGEPLKNFPRRFQMEAYFGSKHPALGIARFATPQDFTSPHSISLHDHRQLSHMVTTAIGCCHVP
jgi:hypothetical protein